MTIEVLTDLLLTVRVNILNDVRIMVVVTAVIDSELVVGVARDVDGLTAAWAADIAVDVLVDINSLAAVVTVLKLVLSSPSKAPIPVC